MYLREIIFFYTAICFVEGELKYNIIVPEFICATNPDLNRNQKKTTTIELVGDAKIDLFKLNFKRIGKPCKNPQRCNLIAWKVTRQFERYLNNYQHTQTNYIEFNNSMLMPGLKYILTVFVSQGQEKSQKQVTLDFVDDYIKSKPLASITLIGVSSTETYINYILNAEVYICSHINTYFLWELNESNNIIKIFPDRSSELNIPPFTLQEGKKYNIRSYLKNLANDEVVAEKLHSIKVLNSNERLLKVKLPMVYTTVKAQQSIYIRPYVKDLANQDDNIKKKWSCLYNNKDLCENITDDELYIENGFINEGEYNISLTVTKNAQMKSAYTLIKVLKNIPTIEIDTVETPVLPSVGTRIKATIEDLRTFCTIQWKSEEGPYSIDLNSIPGNVNQVQHVIARRDLFLKELEEFSSEVVTKEYSLTIPPPLGNWLGLPNLGEDYKLQFLLEVTCPKAQLEHNELEMELTEDFLNNTITISAVIEIDVVVAPKLQPLEVYPGTGVALETVFTFKCGEASKPGVTYFFYRFGYLLGGKKIVFSNKLGFRSAESVLPYNDAVETFVEVCEESNSCDTIFGPSIKTTLPNDLNERILSGFDEKLNTEDFSKAFGYALSILTVTEEVETYNKYFSNGILSKIRYLLDTYADDENWRKRVNKLIDSIKEFSKELSFSEDVLNGLIELRDKLLMEQKEKLLVLHRNLLTTNRKKVTLENFKSYIEVSDLVITSSSDPEKVEAEKLVLERKIREYLGRLCAQLYEKQQTISLKYQILILVVEKLPKKSYNNMHVIPFADNPWNATAEVKLDIPIDFGKDKLCIAKTLHKDYFNKSGISYGAYVLDGDTENVIDESIKTTVLMPMGQSKISNTIPKCLVYNATDGSWISNCTYIKQVSKFAQYSCSTTGAYYLEYSYEETFDTKMTTIHIQSTNIDENTEKPTLTTSIKIKNDEDSKTTNKDEITTDLNIETERPTTLITEVLTTPFTENPVDEDASSALTFENSFTEASSGINTPEVVSGSTLSTSDSSDAATEVMINTETGVTVATFASTSPDSSPVTAELSVKESDGAVATTTIEVTSVSGADETGAIVDGDEVGSTEEIGTNQNTWMTVDEGSTVESNKDSTRVTSPATVLTTTNRVDKFGIFGGMNGHFYTNFSVKFSLNATL